MLVLFHTDHRELGAMLAVVRHRGEVVYLGVDPSLAEDLEDFFKQTSDEQPGQVEVDGIGIITADISSDGEPSVSAVHAEDDEMGGESAQENSPTTYEFVKISNGWKMAVIPGSGTYLGVTAVFATISGVGNELCVEESGCEELGAYISFSLDCTGVSLNGEAPVVPHPEFAYLWEGWFPEDSQLDRKRLRTSSGFDED